MCDNKVSYYVPKGYDYREIFIKCGLTDPYGNRAICEDCASDRDWVMNGGTVYNGFKGE